MGFFRRAAAALNSADPVTTAVVSLSPSIRRADRLIAHGAEANGVITGIRFSLNNETVRKEYAVAVQVADGWQRIGIRAQPIAAHRLRLGMSVAVKLDGDRGVFDWETMVAAWRVGNSFLGQEAIRRPPDDGVVDTALDARVQRHLSRWISTDAVIESFARRTVMGMATQNWDITLRLPDGAAAVSKGDDVPSYALWDAAPGVSVPAVVDPLDRSRASINWPAFALAHFDTAAFDDDPPVGSLAAQIEAATSTGEGSGMSAQVPAPRVAGGGPLELDRTLLGWVDAVRGGHMKRRDFDQSLTDWHAAGMCTAGQADAARAAVDA